MRFLAWPTFRCGKIFAYFGQGQQDHPREASVQVLPDADEREALLADQRFYILSYSGPYGWVGLDLSVERPDWQEIANLLDSSYRQLLSADCPCPVLGTTGPRRLPGRPAPLTDANACVLNPAAPLCCPQRQFVMRRNKARGPAPAVLL
ncbi:MmcQ/YjbR family DNA-binding protein [Arthrobacter alpinus]|nr:MmcQ/YjbR family DNA-binding protein [Arthrobacter alpinus]